MIDDNKNLKNGQQAVRDYKACYHFTIFTRGWKAGIEPATPEPESK